MQRQYQNSNGHDSSAARSKNISQRLIKKADIVDAEFEVIELDNSVSEVRSSHAPRPTNSKAYRTHQATQFFTHPIWDQANHLAKKTAPNRVAFYTISAALVVFAFWWTGGYSLLAPSNALNDDESIPIAKVEQSLETEQLDLVSTGTINPTNNDQSTPNSSSFQALEADNPNLTTDTSIETLDVAPQIEKSKSSFVFATGPEKGSHRSLQFKPSY